MGALLVLPASAQEAKLTGSDAGAGSEFGTAVAIDGDYAIIGARLAGTPGNNHGAAYIFVRSATGWIEQAKLVASDREEEDRFGTSVAITSNFAVVGASGEDTGGENAGAAYVYAREGETWVEQVKLTAGDANSDDRFGVAVAIDGNTIFVGAIGDDDIKEDAGALYVFKRNGETWIEQDKINTSDIVNGDAFGNAVAIDGAYGVVGAVGDNFPSGKSGSAYVFVDDNGTWTEQDKISASDGVADNFFGNAVAISGDQILVGMSEGDQNGEDAGAAYVFQRDGETWIQQAILTPASPAAGDKFGHAVAIDGNVAVVSAPGRDGDLGAAYVFQGSGASWTAQATLTASDSATNDDFGLSAAVSGVSAFIGARRAEVQLQRTGVTYAYVIAAPSPPALASPANNASGLSTSVTLRWDKARGADTYHVQVATSSSFSTVVAEALATVDTTFIATGLQDNSTYSWRVAASNSAGKGDWSSIRRFTVGAGTAIEQVDDEIPEAYRLDANYPNPFNPTTTITFALPIASHATLTVYDASGALVTTLVDEQLTAGQYATTWDGTGQASGVYLVRMQAEGFTQTRKMILLK